MQLSAGDGSRTKCGMTKRRKPRWVTPFLRALERTGEVRAAALDAGIDYSTAYARRRGHGAFASAWDAALVAHAGRVKVDEEAEIAAIRNAPSPSHSFAAGPSLSREGRGADREEMTVSSGQVKRIGKGRWSKAKEAVFFEELAATANARMAADAAGVSSSAVFARRLKNRLFAAKWDAVVRASKESIQLYLVEETKKTFDPDELDTGDVAPRVTIDQAIRIAQLNASKTREAEALPNPFADKAAAMGGNGVDELKEGIFAKLMRLRERTQREQLEAGWAYDESFDLMIPPGYVQGPDYVPKPPEEPADFDAGYR